MLLEFNEGPLIVFFVNSNRNDAFLLLAELFAFRFIEDKSSGPSLCYWFFYLSG